MEIVESKQDGILVLEPVGRLDNTSSTELQKKVNSLLEGGERRVVLDLVNTESIGGAGLRVVLMLAKKLESMGGGLILCSMSDQIKGAVEMAGFSRLLAIAPSRDEAVRRHAREDEEARKRQEAEAEVAKVSDLAANLLAAAEKRDTSGQDDR